MVGMKTLLSTAIVASPSGYFSSGNSRSSVIYLHEVSTSSCYSKGGEAAVDYIIRQCVERKGGPLFGDNAQSLLLIRLLNQRLFNGQVRLCHQLPLTAVHHFRDLLMLKRIAVWH